MKVKTTGTTTVNTGPLAIVVLGVAAATSAKMCNAIFSEKNSIFFRFKKMQQGWTRRDPLAETLQGKRQPVIKDPVRYKTEPCKHGWYSNNCPYRDKCQFAHNNLELRRKPLPPPPPTPLPPLPPTPQPTTSLPPPPPSPKSAPSPTSITYQHIVRAFSRPIGLFPALTPTLIITEDDNETLDYLSLALGQNCIACDE